MRDKSSLFPRASNMFRLNEQKVIDFIKENKCKRILLQLPDGLKIKAADVVRKIEDSTGADVLIWFGSNFGACDLPLGVQALGVDLVVGFGHNQYIKTPEW